MKSNYTNWILGNVFLLIIGFTSFSVQAQNYVTIGTGTNVTTSSTSTPYSTLFEDGRHQYLYPVNQMNNNGAVPGMIWSLGFDVGTTTGYPLNGFTIKISHFNGTIAPTAWATNPTVVYVAPGPVIPTLGWNQYTFQTPFLWNGVDGILVEVCFDNNAWSNSTGVRYSSQSNKTRGRYADNSVGCTLGTGFSTSFRPNVRLDTSPLYTNDAGLTAMTNPTFPTCAMDSVVKVSISNMGTDTLTSATVNWSVNGVLQVPYSYTGNLASFANDTVTLGTVAGGLFDGDTIKMWTSMPNGIPDSANFNDTISTVVFNALSGTYSILPNGGGDFHSFTSALNILKSYGICGPVTLEAADSTYNEQLSFTGIDGISSTNTLTLTTMPNVNGQATVSYNASGSADNFVVEIKDIQNVTFDNLAIKSQNGTYCRVVVAGGSYSDSITFNNCLLEANNSSNTSSHKANIYMNDGNDISNWTFTNNTILKGSYGIYFWSGSSSNLSQNNVFVGNHFKNQRYKAVDIYYQNNLVFEENLIESNTTYTSGIGAIFGYSQGGTISKNHVKGTGDWPRYGMTFTHLSGTLANMVQVTNNRIYLPVGTSYVGMTVTDNLFVNYAYNSIYKSAWNYLQNRGFNIQGTGHIELKNNNVQIRKSGTAIYVTGNSLAVCDYNNFSAPDTTCRVGYINGAYRDSLSHWQSASGMDANSISIDSVFTDTANLLVCNPDLYGKGIAMPGHTTDFMGNPRANTPCIGAHEFMPIGTFATPWSDVLCNGDTLMLEQYYFDTVIWNNSDTSNTYQVSSPGTQHVAVHGFCGTDTNIITILPQPLAQIGDTNLCEGTTATLSSGIPNGTHTWSTTSVNPTISVDSAQIVYVTVVDTNGCISSDTAYVTQSFDVSLPDSATFCEGSSVVLDANMTGVYLWNDGSTNQTKNVSTQGMVMVTVTDQNCVSTDSTYVTEILNPIASFTSTTSVFTVSFTNTSQNATDYFWDFGDGNTSTDVNPIHIYSWTGADSVYTTVVLIATNSCDDNTITDDQVRYGQMVNVPELDQNVAVNIYPNPTNGVFNLAMDIPGNVDLNVNILDLTGKSVWFNAFGQVNGTLNESVNLDGLAAGIYFVNIELNGHVSSFKIVLN